MIPVDLDAYRQSVDKASTDYLAAVRRVDLTKSRLKAVVLAAIAAGVSENEVAYLSGVTRKTVRTWQGKR